MERAIKLFCTFDWCVRVGYRGYISVVNYIQRWMFFGMIKSHFLFLPRNLGEITEFIWTRFSFRVSNLWDACTVVHTTFIRFTYLTGNPTASAQLWLSTFLQCFCSMFFLHFVFCCQHCPALALRYLDRFFMLCMVEPEFGAKLTLNSILPQVWTRIAAAATISCSQSSNAKSALGWCSSPLFVCYHQLN